jgi:secondary thiamine-phosphate synthase enzyme
MDIVINSTRPEELIDITDQIRKTAKDSQVKNGIMVLYVPHTTAAITVNENMDGNVRQDILNSLEKMIPKQGKYGHKGGNAYAHIKSSVVGQSLTLIIENGDLKLGKWQSIYFCEFDGPRKRNLYITIK